MDDAGAPRRKRPALAHRRTAKKLNAVDRRSTAFFSSLPFLVVMLVCLGTNVVLLTTLAYVLSAGPAHQATTPPSVAHSELSCPPSPVAAVVPSPSVVRLRGLQATVRAILATPMSNDLTMDEEEEIYARAIVRNGTDTESWKRTVARVVCGKQDVVRLAAIGTSNTVGVGTKAFENPAQKNLWRPNTWADNLHRFLGALLDGLATVVFTNAAVRSSSIWLPAYCLDGMVPDSAHLDLVGIELSTDSPHTDILLDRLLPRTQVLFANNFFCFEFDNDTWEDQLKLRANGLDVARRRSVPQISELASMRDRFQLYGRPPWTCEPGGIVAADRHHMTDYAHQLFAQLMFRFLLRVVLELTLDEVEALAAKPLPFPILDQNAAVCNLSLPEYERVLLPDPERSHGFSLRSLAREKEFWVADDAGAYLSFFVNGDPSYIVFLIMHSWTPVYGGGLVHIYMDDVLQLNFTTKWDHPYSIVSLSPKLRVEKGVHRIDLVTQPSNFSNVTMVFGFFLVPMHLAQQMLLN